MRDQSPTFTIGLRVFGVVVVLATCWRSYKAAVFYGRLITTAQVSLTSRPPQISPGGSNPLPTQEPYVEEPDIFPNRTLVVVMGNLRGGEKAWNTLYDNVLDVNRADLALMIGKTSTDHKNNTNSLFERAKYLWEIDEYDDWGDALDLINGTGWRDTVPNVLHPWSSILGGVKLREYEGSGAIIFMLRWFLSNEIKKHNLTQRYDRFVVTRSDHFYLCAHNVSKLDPNFLWLPTGEDYSGFTDRHLVVSSKDVLPALDILPDLLAHPRKYERLIRRRWANPEKLIKHRWRELNLKDRVRYFDRVMFTCAVKGDTTRWKPMSNQMAPEGVYLKYTEEYDESHSVCSPSSSSS